MKLSLPKFLLFLLVFVLINKGAFAQNTMGDTWHYTYSEEYGPERFPPLLYESAKMEVCGDTLINGLAYFEVCLDKEDMCNPLVHGFLFRNDSGRVYIYNLNWQKEYMLYDFNLGPGESYTFPSETNQDSLFSIKIDSVASVTIFGVAKRIQYVSIEAPQFYDNAESFFSQYPRLSHYLIEDIGSTINYFMWWEGLCHKKRIYNLRCFSRAGQTYTHDTTFAGACDSAFFWQPSSVKKLNSSTISIFPNPAQNRFSISEYTNLDYLEVRDFQGKVMLVTRDFSSSGIDVGDLSNGCYWVSLKYKNGDIFMTQLLILR